MRMIGKVGEWKMRLIDADALADVLFDKRKNYPQWVADTIGAMPDAVVRCKDCRYGQYCTDGETTYQCYKWNSGEFGMIHEHNWFCANGERRTDDA